MGEERELSQDQKIDKILEISIRNDERLTSHLNNHSKATNVIKWITGITISVLGLKWFNK